MGSLVKKHGRHLAHPAASNHFCSRTSIRRAVTCRHRAVTGSSLGQSDEALLLGRGLSGFLALTRGLLRDPTTSPMRRPRFFNISTRFSTALLAFWFLAERPTSATLVCIVLSLLGLGLMVSPYFYAGPGRASTGDLPIAAIFAGLGGALGSGIAYTLVRKLVATEHPSVIVLYFPMVCIPGTLLLGGNDFIWPTPQGWLILLGVGVFTQLGQLSLTRAMQFDSASRTTSLSYLQIVFAAGLGWLSFGEIPRITTLMGAALILLGAFISAKRQPRRQA